MPKTSYRNQQKKISLVNAHGDNFGDFLNLSTTIEILNANSNFELVGIHYAPHQWSHRFPLGEMENLVFSNLSFMNAKSEVFSHLFGLAHDCPNLDYWHELNELTESSDFVLSVPSGQSIGPYQDYAFLIPFVSALRNGKPFGMLFGTAHFSGDVEFDSISSFILKHGSISVRDQESVKFLKSLGVKYWGPTDSSYLYSRNLIVENSTLPKLGEYVCLILGDSLAWHPKASKIEGSSLIHSLAFQIAETILDLSLKSHKRVVLLAHSPLEKEVLRLKEISNNLGDNLLIIETKSLEEYISWINGSALVVSLRYHGAVLAVAHQIPTIAIAYEAKSESFMQERKLKQWCIPLEDYKSETLMDLVNKIFGGEVFTFPEWEDEKGPSVLANFLGHVELSANSPENKFDFNIFQIYESFSEKMIELDMGDSAVAERDSAVAERDSVLNSGIWKTTKPYRWLRSKF